MSTMSTGNAFCANFGGASLTHLHLQTHININMSNHDKPTDRLFGLAPSNLGLQELNKPSLGARDNTASKNTTIKHCTMHIALQSVPTSAGRSFYRCQWTSGLLLLQ